MLRILCILLLLALPSPLTTAATPGTASGSLLGKAAGLSDLRAGGSPPFRIQARIRLYGSSNQPSEGTYLLAWNSPTQWLEELALPTYSEQRWGGDRKIWWRRNTSYEPLRVYQLRRAMDLGSLLALDSDDRPGKLRQSGSLTCIPVEVTGAAADTMTLLMLGNPLAFPVEGPELTVPSSREFCVDAARGTLTRYQEPGLAFEYGDYRVIGDKWFPGKIQIKAQNQLVADVQVQELVASPSDASLFVPSRTAQEWPSCESPRPPRYLSEYKSQQFSEHRTKLAAEKARAFGQIHALLAVYAVIQVDGKLQNLQVVETAGREQDGIALDMLRHASYAPQMCGETPVPTEVVIRIEYLRALQDYR